MSEPLPQQNSPNSEIQSNTHPASWAISVFNGLGGVMTRVGIVGFIVLSFVIFILFFVSAEQHAQIVDTWILFNGNHAPPVIIIFVLILILFFQQLHYKRVIHAKDEKIKELADGKNSKFADELDTRSKKSLPKKNKKKD